MRRRWLANQLVPTRAMRVRIPSSAKSSIRRVWSRLVSYRECKSPSKPRPQPGRGNPKGGSGVTDDLGDGVELRQHSPVLAVDDLVALMILTDHWSHASIN